MKSRLGWSEIILNGENKSDKRFVRLDFTWIDGNDGMTVNQARDEREMEISLKCYTQAGGAGVQSIWLETRLS